MAKRKNVGGRPTKMTEETIKKLEDIFKNGANVGEACSYAGISTVIYYDHLKKNHDFLTKMESAQYYPTIVAKNVIVGDIVKGKNVDSAKWYLERKSRSEFSLRQEHTGADGGEIVVKIEDFK